MIMIIMILKKDESIWSPLYALGSSYFPLPVPFHKAFSLGWPYFVGIIFVIQMMTAPYEKMEVKREEYTAVQGMSYAEPKQVPWYTFIL